MSVSITSKHTGLNTIRMVRAPFVNENGLKKGAWSVEEDNKLRSYIQKYGHWNWRELPKFAGLARCGKSCRLRWINYLRPNVKHGSYTKEEEELVIKLHQQLGNRWSKIARHLPGRTDNEVKNYWHTHLKKRVHHQQTTTTNKKKMRSLTRKSQSLKNPEFHNTHDNVLSRLNVSETNDLHILESYPLSPEDTNFITKTCSLNSETLGSPSTFKDGGTNNNNDSIQSIWDSMGEGEVIDPSFWTKPYVLETYQQYDDDANFNFLDGELLESPTLSSYWDMMDFSCSFDTDVVMQCRNEVDPSCW